ncbi:MAG: exodeoxyribonuclease V subunit gamma [Thermodesulfobacteriota bacterium]
MNLSFYTSNRLEKLADLFAVAAAGAARSPFDRQIVVVQTAGMGRWLSLWLADRNRICAGMEFLYPNAVVERLFSLVLPDGAWQPENPAITAWRIMALLPELCREPAARDVFAPVADYLADDESGVKLYQLAMKIADLFDQYQIYRPDLVLAWEEGRDPHDERLIGATGYGWQKMLWRRLGLPAGRARCHRNFLRRMADPDMVVAARLPARLTLFGVAVIPPLYLDIFAAVARHLPVFIYLLQPCREYWGFIRSAREIRRQERAAGRGRDELLLEEVNPLLASQGILGRDFFNMMLTLDDERHQVEECFLAGPADSLLHLVQRDLLDLVDPEETPAVPPVAGDLSIQFHSCHSPLREVEVLYDQLLHLLQQDPTLTPSDILVMAPELPVYAPLIRVVFDSSYSTATKLPYAIADLPAPGLQVLMDAFLHLLTVLRSRFRASEVLGLLDIEAVAARFFFTVDERELVRTWVEAAGIRWGADKEMVVGEGLPPHDLSWEAGRERLLLGYAMVVEKGREVVGAFPCPEVDEGCAVLLGRFLDFYDTLTRFRKRITSCEAEGGSLGSWSSLLGELLDAFFAGGPPYEADRLILEAELAALAHEEELIGRPLHLSLEAVRTCLFERHNATLHARGFMGGGITFCAMLPMRSIPFRVICMIGMNDGVFPRLDRSLEYDLSRIERRLGDRSRKENDKYLFLETLISARDILYISYTGQSIVDNSPVPPAAPVGELLDYLGLRLRLSQAERAGLVVRHRLQSFNREYFRQAGRLFSYSEENCRAAAAGLDRRPSSSFFASGPLAAGPELVEIRLEELLRFFAHPVRFLYTRVLHIELDERAQAVADHEPFETDGLQAYRVRAELLPRPGEEGTALDTTLRRLHQRALLPLGAPGQCWTGALREEMVHFRRWLAGLVSTPLPPRPVALTLPSGIVIRGVLDRLFPDFQLFYRPARLGAEQKRNGSVVVADRKMLIAAWICHLVANAAAVEVERTVCAGIDCSAVCFSPVAEAARLLDELILLYRQGQRCPLRFLPRYSLALAEGAKRDTVAVQLRGGGGAGRVDPYLRHCFGEEEVVDATFVALAAEIGGPLYQHLQLFGEGCRGRA